MGKPAARMGDMTVHGGNIVVGAPTVLIGGQPAARVGDMHVCPMQTMAGPVPVPHVGGPIMPPGALTVLICGQPAACVGDMCTCVGPPDTIAPPGCPTVLISPGGGGGGGGGAGGSGSGSAANASSDTSAVGKAQAMEAGKEVESHFLDVKFVDKGGKPIIGPSYKLEAPDGTIEQSILAGQIRKVGPDSGNYKIELKAITEAKWSKDSALDGETVKLQVKLAGIEDGTGSVFEIYERNPNTPDNKIHTIEDVTVSGDKLEAEWAYEWVDDTEEEQSATQTQSGQTSQRTSQQEEEEEQQAQQPKPYCPKFFYKVKVAGCEAQSAMMEYKDFIEINLKDDDDQGIADANYLVFLSSGEVRKGQLDGNGYKKIENVAPGKWSVKFPDHSSLEETENQ